MLHKRTQQYFQVEPQSLGSLGYPSLQCGIFIDLTSKSSRNRSSIIIIWKLVRRKNPSNSHSLHFKKECIGIRKVNAIQKQNKEQTIKQTQKQKQRYNKRKKKLIKYWGSTKLYYRSLTEAIVKRLVSNAVLKAEMFLMWVGRRFHSLGAQQSHFFPNWLKSCT